MWVLKYLVGLVRKHIFAAITLGKLPYRYCLRCGKLELKEADNHDAGESVVSSTVGRKE